MLQQTFAVIVRSFAKARLNVGSTFPVIVHQNVCFVAAYRGPSVHTLKNTCVQFHILICRLHKTQDLLYDSTRDFLTLRYEHREHERQWMAEKDKLLQQLDICHQELNLDRGQTEAAVLNESAEPGPMSRHEEYKVRQCMYIAAIRIWRLVRPRMCNAWFRWHASHWPHVNEVLLYQVVMRPALLRGHFSKLNRNLGFMSVTRLLQMFT